MNDLIRTDMEFVVRRLPTDIRTLLKEFEGKLFVAGGFVRAVIAGEDPSDIDIFGINKETLKAAAESLVNSRGANTRQHRTKNAITVISIGRMTVQFITRWTFASPEGCAESFDFTVCQAAVWREDGSYKGICSPRFYHDLAARRLVYTCPTRDEEVGGSLLRAIKYAKRGYVIQVESLGRVVARLTSKVDHNRIDSEERMGTVLTGLLREVDPNMSIDGLDVHDDHETSIEGIEDEELDLATAIVDPWVVHVLAAAGDDEEDAA